MSQGKTYTFQRQGLENTIISMIRGQGKSGIFLKNLHTPTSRGAYIRDFTVLARVQKHAILQLPAPYKIHSAPPP